jgi:hypothetical protein
LHSLKLLLFAIDLITNICLFLASSNTIQQSSPQQPPPQQPPPQQPPPPLQPPSLDIPTSSTPIIQQPDSSYISPSRHIQEHSNTASTSSTELLGFQTLSIRPRNTQELLTRHQRSTPDSAGLLSQSTGLPHTIQEPAIRKSARIRGQSAELLPTKQEITTRLSARIRE